MQPTIATNMPKLRWPVAKHILIVEDDFDVAQSIADVLEAEGYRVSIAGNGQEALEHLRGSEHPALILLDMMMPVMDGWRFREAQQRIPEVASIPVVTVTADGDARGKAAAIGAAGHLGKPVTMDALLDEVERLCGRPSYPGERSR
jgi:CheY-like chemotaxis protein